jgi:hypothetical protein
MAITTNQRQLPDHAILDHFNKQVYLGNKFIFNTGNMTLSGTSETAVLLISNAVSNTATPNTVAAPNGLFLDHIKGTCLTSSDNVQFNVYINPTLSSSGTAATPVNLRSGSATTSIATLATNGATALTASANGTLVRTLISANQLAELSDLMNILDPGQSILITAIASASSAHVTMQISWYEL